MIQGSVSQNVWKEKKGVRFAQREVWHDGPQPPSNFVRGGTGGFDYSTTQREFRIPEGPG